MSQFLRTIVKAKEKLTPTITEFTLVSEDEGTQLPTVAAGGHIAVETPVGAMRRYSVVHPGKNLTEYVIAVKRDPNSRGGSKSLHDDLNTGDLLKIEEPQNDFELTKANNFLLIAGGIGVTPIYAMAQELTAAGKQCSVIYCTRTAEETAYLEELRHLQGDELIIHHDEGDLSQTYDFWDHFETPSNAHVFCCGPAPLMEEIEAISGHWPEGAIHFENFKPVDVTREDDKPFNVVISSTGQTVSIPADRSILEALREKGVQTASSCESGTCGTCKCRLIEGKIDHRDMVLMEEEKQDHIMICVSRSKGGDLVIDL